MLMLRSLGVEWSKSKRGFERKLIFAGPVFVLLFAIFVVFQIPHGVDVLWINYGTMIFNWWGLLFYPIGTAMFCLLCEARERKGNTYRVILPRVKSKGVLWLSKIAVISGYTFLAALLITVPSFLFLLKTQGIDSGLAVLETGMFSWFAALPLVPIELFLANWKGSVTALTAAFAGIISEVFTSPKNYWFINPWSYPVRIMSPLIHIHPNGVRLPSGDALNDPSVIPAAIVLSFILLLLLSAVTAGYFSKKEIR